MLSRESCWNLGVAPERVHVSSARHSIPKDVAREDYWAPAEGIWRQDGLRLPKKQAGRGPVGLNDGSCIRLWHLYRHRAWTYEFVADRSHDNGSPWKNGYNESFNGTLGDEVLKREIFFNLAEAKVLIEQWRREYNTIRPHSSLGYRPPAPEAVRPDPAFLNLPALRGPHPQREGALN